MTGRVPHRRIPPSLEYVTDVCETGKRGFWSKSGARAAAKDLKKKGAAGRGLQAYNCQYCDYFHIGHLSQAVRQGRVSKEEAYPKEDRAS